MPILHAVVLGFTQGLTEFLPISSSGHLRLVPWLFGWDDFDDEAVLKRTFDVALHLGTLIGVVAYFRQDIIRIVRNAFDRVAPPSEHRLGWLLILSAVPAAVVGALLDDVVDEHLGAIPLIAVMLIVFGLLLGAADRLAGDRKADEFGLRDALAMGVGQAVALSPGVSRSGVTMSVGRFIGFDRDAAARLSFLMSIPVTGGALLYTAAEALSDGVPSDLWWPMAAGVVASGLAGWVAVWATLRLVRTRTFAPFVGYRVVAGCAVLIIGATSWR